MQHRLFRALCWPCVDRSEVMDEGPNYATALLSKFCARARCPPVLTPSGVATIDVQSL